MGKDHEILWKRRKDNFKSFSYQINIYQFFRQFWKKLLLKKLDLIKEKMHMFKLPDSNSYRLLKEPYM